MTDSSAAANASSAPLKHGKAARPTALIASVILLASLGAMLLLARLFWFDVHRISSTAMEPTLPRGSLVISARRGLNGALATSTLARGDLLIFEYPKDPNQTFVKRLIGLPGDRVEIDAKGIRINGVAAHHERLRSIWQHEVWRESWQSTSYSIQRQLESTHTSPSGTWVVPDAQYFVLGDNRDNSLDSRYWGFVPANALRGRVVYVLKIGN